MASKEEPKMATKEEFADKPKRQLLKKGPLKPPRPRPPGASITQDRPSKDEVTIGAKRSEPKVISLAGSMSQPFVNPDDEPFAPISGDL